MKQKDFELTAIVSQEVQHKVDVEPLESVLNTNLSLADYGDTVKKIYFVFVAVKPEDNQHRNDVTFNTDTNTLELKLNLSYPHVYSSSSDEVWVMMATLFLKAIDLYKGLSINNLDIHQFRENVKELFRAHNFLLK